MGHLRTHLLTDLLCIQCLIIVDKLKIMDKKEMTFQSKNTYRYYLDIGLQILLWIILWSINGDVVWKYIYLKMKPRGQIGGMSIEATAG